MALSAETKNRLFIALTGHEYSDELVAVVDAVASGTATVAIGDTTVTVTDARASATSVITASFAEVDATAIAITRIERLAGSFVIHVGAAATAATDIMWIRVG